MKFTFLTLAIVASLGTLTPQATAASFEIEPIEVNLVVAAEFKHENVRIPIVGTAGGFNFSNLTTSTTAAWAFPAIDTSTREVVLILNTAGLLNSNNTATITVSGNGSSDSFVVKAAVAPLNITKLIDDPVRSRTYGIQQNGNNAGAIVAIDPLTNTKLKCLTVGKKPSDFAISSDGSEMLVINAADPSIYAIDLATFQVKQTINLATYGNWGVNDTDGDVQYGAGDIIYYSDGSWAPILYVFDRSTKQVLQQVTDEFGFGDFALTPDKTSLVAWGQYGWTAGSAASYLMRYTVAADGRLTFAERTATGYPNPPLRDPLDTPVLIESAGTHAFAKEFAVSTANVKETYRTFPSGVYSISPGGEVAVTSTAIVETSTSLSLFTLPVTTPVHAITSDYARLVYFDKAARTIGTINLLEAIGPEVLNRNLVPADGAITLSPPRLEWSELPGVVSYRVYLGTSESLVEAAGPADPAFLAEVTTPSVNITGQLSPGTRYFWRVDAVTSGGVAKGDVYEFTVSKIGSSLASITAATVQGHTAYLVESQLAAASEIAWTATADAPWVGFVSASGSAPGTLSVRLNASTLSAGRYRSSIHVNDSATGQTIFTLPVVLDVDPLAITAMESARDSSTVYAISEFNASTGTNTRAYLLEIDSASKAIKRVTRAGSSATDLTVHYPENRVYVANWRLGSLVAIDRDTFKQVRGYGFSAWGSGVYDGDVYRVSAGAAGRVMVEEADQWVNISIYDTENGLNLKQAFVREGGGEFAPGGRYYYHGDNNSSGAEIHKFDVIGDTFTELAHKRVEGSGTGYYGSRTLIMSENGERVFWNGAVFDKNLNVEWLIGDEIYSASADGRLAFSAKSIYDLESRTAIFAMPLDTKISAYNSTTGRLVVQSGDQIKFFDIGVNTTLPAPVLSVVGATPTSVELSWTEDSLETSFTIEKRQSGTTIWQTVSTSIAANTRNYTVNALAPTTEYEFRIKANSALQSSEWSALVSATTTAPTLPSATTLAATSITASGAILNGSANPNGRHASARFEYGLTTQYGATTLWQSLGNGSTALQFSANATFLQPSTTYHFRLVVENTDGTATGMDQTFTTAAAKPFITAVVATDISPTSVLLSASVNPNGNATTVAFEYGTSMTLGQTSAITSIGNGSVANPVSETISGLTPNSLYYYRVVATNIGGTTTTSIGSFKTLTDGGTETLFAGNDFLYTIPGEPRVIEVLANDTGSGLHVVSLTPASAGNATLNADSSITYTPGAAFDGYDSFTYTIQDNQANVASATVTVRNTYTSTAGTYHALIGSHLSSFSQAGTLLVTATRNGVLTGVVQLAGKRRTFKAKLRYDGIVSTFVGSDGIEGPDSLVVTMVFDPEARALTGTAFGTGPDSLFGAYRAPYNSQNVAPEAGRYTMLIPLNEGSNPAEGHGYATLRVSPSGVIQIAGRSNSGAGFTTAAYLGADSRFPVYALTSGAPRSSVQGWAKFRTITGTSDFDGLVGTAAASSAAQRHGAFIGSRYVRPGASGLILPFPAGSQNALLEVGQGPLDPVGLSTPATLTSKTLVPASAQFTRCRIEPTTGLFSGAVSMAGNTWTYRGVAFQRQGMGAGVARKPDAAGWVILRDAAVNAPVVETRR